MSVVRVFYKFRPEQHANELDFVPELEADVHRWYKDQPLEMPDIF